MKATEQVKCRGITVAKWEDDAMIGIVLSLFGVVCTLLAIWVQLCHIETVLTIIAKNDGDNWEWKKR